MVQADEGGVNVNIWSESVAGEDIYKAVQFETRTGLKLRFPKCLVLAKLDTEFKRDNISLLKIKLKVLSPASGKPSCQVVTPA